LPASVVYADSGYLAANPEVVSCVTSAWFEALAWIVRNPEETAKLTAAFYGDPADSAYKDWQESGIVFDPVAGLSSVAPLSKMLFAVGTLKRPYTSEEVLFFTSLGEGSS